MMAGKPIVASKVDAIPNIVRNEENGLLVEVDNATEASEAMIRLYRNAKFKLFDCQHMRIRTGSRLA